MVPLVKSKANEVKKIATKSEFTIGKAFICSTLLHTLVFSYLILDRSFSSLKSSVEKAQKEPISVSLYEILLPESVYDSLPEAIGYNPKVPIGQKTQTSDLEKKLGNQIEDKKEEQESLEVAIRKTPETFEYDQNLRNKLEEMYNDFKHTYKPGERNEVDYVEFFKLYVNNHFNSVGMSQHIHSFQESNLRPNELYFYFKARFYENGKFEITFRPHPLFIHIIPKTIRIYKNLLELLPKTFIPPESAGLRSPFEVTYMINDFSAIDPIPK